MQRYLLEIYTLFQVTFKRISKDNHSGKGIIIHICFLIRHFKLLPGYIYSFYMVCRNNTGFITKAVAYIG